MEEIRKLEDIKFRKDLYPRIKHDWDAVDRYVDSIDQLPPIEVNQHNELIDGWHRWTAHQKVNAEAITVVVTQTQSDAHFVRLAIERNRAHGVQLSQKDKQEWTVKLYVSEPERGKKRHEELANLFGVGVRTVERWLQDIDKQYRERQKETAEKMWLACYTQQEIAEVVGSAQQTVADWIGTFTDLRQLSKSGKTLADYAEPDWSPPLYNVWADAKIKHTAAEHFGNVPPDFVDRLVYLYTQPLDVVVDLFAGSGSTIDICRKRYRRHWVSDRKPVERRADEIRQWDINDGLPRLPSWQDVKLVYLDPPYWKQAEGRYSEDAEDLANMELDNFTDSLVTLVESLASKLKDAHIALIILPTQWKTPDKSFTDHVSDLLKAIKIPVKIRIQVPYSTQQCSPQMVQWAKDNKQLLVLSREIIVWQVK